MQMIGEIVRQELKERDYYFGTILFAMGSICGEVSKYRKNQIDSGMASQDTNFPLIMSLIGIFCFLFSMVFMFNLNHKLRQSFAKYQPTFWQFTLSWTWVAVKGFLITFLLLLPLFVYMGLNFSLAMTNPIRYVSIVAILFIIPLPFLAVFYFQSQALVVARGRSGRAMRDSFKALALTWRQMLLSLALMLVPLFIVAPFRLLSFKFAVMEYVAMGLNVCAAPYQFALMTAVYLYLGKTITEKDPALAELPARA